MIAAKILFLGLVMLCGKADPEVCTGEEIRDTSPVRALVLDLSANAFNCDANKCYVCPDTETEIKFHKPVLIFQLSATSLGECSDSLCPQKNDLCCLDLHGKQVTVHAGRGITLSANRRDRDRTAPRDRLSFRHAFDWVAEMSYFEPDLKLLGAEYLQPGQGYGGSRPRVAAWVDFDDGRLGSTLLARGEARNSEYVRWGREESTSPQNQTALAESLLWEKNTNTFALVVEDDSGPRVISFKNEAPRKARVVVSNLPDIPLEVPRRKPGYDTADHFKSYYNVFKSSEGCHQPHQNQEHEYYTGGVDLVSWLLGDGDLPVVIEAGKGVIPRAGISGDNAVCSPSKFP